MKLKEKMIELDYEQLELRMASMINFITTTQGNLTTLTHPLATIEARKQGFMTYIQVFKRGKVVYSKHVHRDRTPETLLKTCQGEHE